MAMQEPSADHASANDTAHTIRPGEFSHYYLNFLALFGQQRTTDEVERIAREAVVSRDKEILRFQLHLKTLYAGFREQMRISGTPRATTSPSPVLSGWDRIPLDELRREHGSVLVAMFHYGKHRQVLSDLAVLGCSFIAPVAKQSYFECQRVNSIAPPAFETAMDLIEVESPKVGRTLLRGLRHGRIGLIYVDGNMGPDGHEVEEGAVGIDFLGRRIKVKEGIARLAHSLRLPVLPLFVVPSPAGEEPSDRVHAGPLLHPLQDRSAAPEILASSRLRMMQSLYDLLAEQVVRAASPWEFAFCLHRWIVDAGPSRTHVDLSVLKLPAQLSLRKQQIALYERDGDPYWVDVDRQKAFRLPDWAHGLYEFLAQQTRSIEETQGWLRERDVIDDDATQFLSGLGNRGLISGAAPLGASR